MIFILLGGVPIIVAWCALFFGWFTSNKVDKEVNREFAVAIGMTVLFIASFVAVVYGFTAL